jgi:hypothetical protein
MADAMTAQGAAVAASAVYPTASLAIFVPFRLDQPRTYVKAWWQNGAAVAGNVDVGIYTLSGSTMTRVVASVAEAQATINVLQVAASFASTTIGPGLYYMAMSATSATAQFQRAAPNAAVATRILGIYQAATSSPLPSTATAVAATNAYVPLFGLSELATV